MIDGGVNSGQEKTNSQEETEGARRIYFHRGQDTIVDAGESEAHSYRHNYRRIGSLLDGLLADKNEKKGGRGA